MRNIDKIKNLENELGRYRKKVTDQQKEVTALREELTAFRGGMSELNKTADALCISVAVKYGAQVAPDVLEASVPEIRVSELLEAYELNVDAKRDQYIIRAKKRQVPQDDGN